jgi:plasmid maintenance system antidote protein VapI
MGISINQLARDLVVPPGRISGSVNGRRAVSADTALRPGKYFGVCRKPGSACKPTMICG